MWNELRNRVEVSIATNIPVTDLKNLIQAYEDHFKQEIMEEALKEEENKKKKKK